MCDTLCVLRPSGALFAKNSDRPPAEVQLTGSAPRRPGGSEVRAQYLTLPDTGALGTLLSRPTWLWGAEHGVNERRVAIGNERVYTRADAHAAPEGLIGMDLVRLALERAASAEEAVDVLGDLLVRHGQGGVGDRDHAEAYFSSFLVADPADVWTVETSGRSWAAARASAGGTSVSNRLSLGTSWERASADVAPGTDLDIWRDPGSPTGHADRRLALSRGFVSSGGDLHELVAVLRDHGRGPGPSPPPRDLGEDLSGVSVCMHIPGYMATTSSLVADLPRDPEAPVRCWVAPGSPCVSLYVPAFAPQLGCPEGAVPSVLGDEGAWRDVAVLREVAQRRDDACNVVRERLDPIEQELWAEADAVAPMPQRWAQSAAAWSVRVREVFAGLVAEMNG